ncbi:MAG: hypothetical protein JRH11_15330, partial [Deltaproteobacteria bacterium]|nr:hypothetical protein [Deltaproteobacteria bacterium]
LFEDVPEAAALADASSVGGLADLFADDVMADGGDEPIADIESVASSEGLEHQLFEDDDDDYEGDATNAFTLEDVAAIERHSEPPPPQTKSQWPAPIAESETPPAPIDGEVERELAAVEEKHAAVEAAVAAEAARAEQAAIAAGVEAADFELMIDDDDLMMLDDDDLLEEDPDLETEPPQSPPESQSAPPTDAPEEGKGKEKEETGFFKKLFGGD